MNPLLLNNSTNYILCKRLQVMGRIWISFFIFHALDQDYESTETSPSLLNNFANNVKRIFHFEQSKIINPIVLDVITEILCTRSSQENSSRKKEKALIDLFSRSSFWEIRRICEEIQEIDLENILEAYVKTYNTNYLPKIKDVFKECDVMYLCTVPRLLKTYCPTINLCSKDYIDVEFET
ncbi:hypothetical protein RF11_12357 [Thelohanellus kitauei]|uniref:Uncharacterized protein n=1 Tax=Thelohanellus kitauei TaxID=669202 RepID=A0A0C2N975_THEKT|nr:hypothetical protein RF11_12357 [Thelohanellus kitauei]